MKLITGGQTGVDRAVLDLALALQMEIGGWCPENRQAEDGILDEKYPLQALPQGGYDERTRQNVQDSDGTLILYFGYLYGGTETTLHYAIELHKPYLLLDMTELSHTGFKRKACEFIHIHDIALLNIAGPRASDEPDAYKSAYQALDALFQDLLTPTI